MMPGFELTDRFYALTGGIGTGKSAVARFFSDRGAHIIDTDLVAREVVKPGGTALSEIAQYFGDEVMNTDGTLNRTALRDRIIRDRGIREKLNRIVHPRVMEIMEERIESLGGGDGGMPVIVDVPLLYEVGWDRLFRKVILAYAPFPTQIARLMERDGIDREAAGLAIAAQMSIEVKRVMASYIIDNSGPLEHTREQVDRLFGIITRGTSGQGC
jgi:dephospho-CoA kinase